MCSLPVISGVLLCLASAGLAFTTPDLPVISNQVFVVTNAAFAGGALGNGVSNSTAAIQSAINFAGSHGGGTVEIPANGTLSTYLSFPFSLVNSINLQIDSGATLKMPAFASYPSNADFITGTSLHDIELSGSGTIDGSAVSGSPGWWDGRATSTRPLMIVLGTCQRLLIQNLHLKNPPKMHIGFKGTGGNITIQGITINTPVSPNTDGIDLAGTNCLVQNCSIADGDDNIAFSPTVGTVDANILITNCTFGIGHGVSMGSNTAGGISNLTLSGSSFTGTDFGIRLKSDNNTNTGGTLNGRGGVVESLTYSNITMANIQKGGIVVYSYYNEVGTPSDITPFGASTQVVDTIALPLWRNITISNVTATVASAAVPGILWGRMEAVISNVTLSQVNLTGSKPFEVYNARAIRFIDSQFTTPGTNALLLFNAEITVTNSVPVTNLVTVGGLAKPGTNNTMSFFNAFVAITDTNVLGAGPITLGGSTLSFTQNAVNASNNVNVVSASTLAFAGGGNTFNGVLSGPGPLTLNLPGTSQLTLRGDSSGFGGTLVVSNSGTLLVNNITGSGTGTGAVTVTSGGALGGSGIIAGPMTVNGTLAPGSGVGTLAISNNLVVNGGAVLQYDLGTSSDLTVVSGNLTLGGVLNVTDAGGFGLGTNTLFTYGGALTYNGVTFGTVPAGFSYSINTNTVGQVNLVVSPPLTAFQQWQIQYFGGTTNPAAAPGADPFGKGMSNTNQFLAGLDPTNPASVFRITSAVRNTTDVVITWTTAGVRTNAVQATGGGANGSFATNFTDISGQIILPVAGDTVTNYLDSGGATNTPARYYRIRLAP